MKRKLLSAVCCLMLTYSGANAQMRGYFQSGTDGYAQVDVLYGGLTEALSRANLQSEYKNYVNAYAGKLSFSGGNSVGISGKVGYYLNQSKTLGLTVGLIYQKQSGTMALDSFHIEYQSVDAQKRTFRQLLSLHPDKEAINSQNISVPFMLHYQKKMSDAFFISVDGGILYNVSMSTTYASNTSVNEEAMYQYNSATKTFVYNSSPKPSGTGFIPITLAQYYKINPKGTDPGSYLAGYGDNFGANVGYGKSLSGKTGSANYTNGSIGYIIEPSLNFQLSDLTYLNVGAYYTYQDISNSGSTTKQFVTGKGVFEGLANSTSSITGTGIGLTVGIKYVLKSRKGNILDYVENM